MDDQVRLGLPFNGVIPLWHQDAQITWHRPVDDTDLSQLVGMGYIVTQPGPSAAPPGWEEQVETGIVTAADPGAETAPNLALRLRLRGELPAWVGTNLRQSACVALSPALSVQDAMGAAENFDYQGLGIHVARLMLTAARAEAILLFTLRAPRDPQPHHLLSIPSSIDADLRLHFHLGTLFAVKDDTWKNCRRTETMYLLDLDVDYAALLADLPANARSEGLAQGLRAEKLLEMAQPVVAAILQPGFPFALGYSFIVRK